MGATGEAVEAGLQPVYELAPDALFGRQMVMTPGMLVDRLHGCQEAAERLRDVVRQRRLGEEQRFGFEVNPVADQLDRLSEEIRAMLTLLGRGGLWTDAALTEGAATDGRQFWVLREPFMDGGAPGERVSGNAFAAAGVG